MNQHLNLQNPLDYVARQKQLVTIDGATPYFIEGSSGTAFLLLHGWSASAESVRFLASGLAGAGHAVLAPTLPGHGSSNLEMLTVGPVEWNEAARDAAKTLRDNFQSVVVMGVSMGGALAIQLAATSPQLIDGLVTINAPIFMGNSSFASEIVASSADPYLEGWNVPSFFGEPVEEISYPKRHKKSGADLYSMCGLARELLPLVTSPMLVVQSILDPVVPKASADEILARSGAPSKDVLWLEQSYHVSQLDLDRDRIIAAALTFLAAHDL
ncbi:alpha/beta hydrolase [Rhizobium leguminosarum]|uniref:alpha/beta hydrolase n=1 Tax=Rhizobium leguminosarum TaxID=384 RepID=UPI0009B768B4|nr:alpha/beta fold hydrolase [Rhizobium leguminosarum]MBY5313058.1 alpha/beta fold hydrolase [Rhizobium leguminosarum]